MPFGFFTPAFDVNIKSKQFKYSRSWEVMLTVCALHTTKAMPPREQFQPPTQVDCTRCAANTSRGTRCTRSTCKYADKCWQHTRQDEGVEIKKDATDPNKGFGLWATRDLPAGKRFRYARSPLDEVEPAVVGQWPDWRKAYVFCNGNETKCWDARSTQSGLARWVNEVGRARTNAKLTIAPNQQSASIVTTKRVAAGREIVTNYGPAYRRNYRLR